MVSGKVAVQTPTSCDGNAACALDRACDKGCVCALFIVTYVALQRLNCENKSVQRVLFTSGFAFTVAETDKQQFRINILFIFPELSVTRSKIPLLFSLFAPVE